MGYRIFVFTDAELAADGAVAIVCIYMLSVNWCLTNYRQLGICFRIHHHLNAY